MPLPGIRPVTARPGQSPVQSTRPVARVGLPQPGGFGARTQMPTPMARPAPVAQPRFNLPAPVQAPPAPLPPASFFQPGPVPVPGQGLMQPGPGPIMSGGPVGAPISGPGNMLAFPGPNPITPTPGTDIGTLTPDTKGMNALGSMPTPQMGFGFNPATGGPLGSGALQQTPQQQAYQNWANQQWNPAVYNQDPANYATNLQNQWNQLSSSQQMNYM